MGKHNMAPGRKGSYQSSQIKNNSILDLTHLNKAMVHKNNNKTDARYFWQSFE